MWGGGFDVFSVFGGVGGLEGWIDFLCVLGAYILHRRDDDDDDR